MKTSNRFLQRAVELSLEAIATGQGFPFGAVVVCDEVIVGEGSNRVIADNDPSAHAEILAIRAACARLGTYQLEDCELYTSCEPCPMCLGAVYWAKIPKVYYANTRHDAAEIGFIDAFIYEQIPLPTKQRQVAMEQLEKAEAMKAFEAWKGREGQRSTVKG